MEQKMVIKLSMPCEKSRSKAMALAARQPGVSSVGIAGDGRDRLEVVGVGVDPVRLACCLRRKLGHAEILQVEEVKKEKEPKPVVVAPPHCVPAGYYWPPPPLQVVHEEPSPCSIM